MKTVRSQLKAAVVAAAASCLSRDDVVKKNFYCIFTIPGGWLNGCKNIKSCVLAHLKSNIYIFDGPKVVRKFKTAHTGL